MDPLTVLAAVNAGLKLAKTLLPEVDRMFQAGLITAEQQAEAHDNYQSLKTLADGQFSGPHWQIDPDPATPPTD